MWLYNSSTQTFWTYDDPLTVRLKTIYINRGGLGGGLIKTLAKGLSGHDQ